MAYLKVDQLVHWLERQASTLFSYHHHPRTNSTVQYHNSLWQNSQNKVLYTRHNCTPLHSAIPWRGKLNMDRIFSRRDPHHYQEHSRGNHLIYKRSLVLTHIVLDLHNRPHYIPSRMKDSLHHWNLVVLILQAPDVALREHHGLIEWRRGPCGAPVIASFLLLDPLRWFVGAAVDPMMFYFLWYRVWCPFQVSSKWRWEELLRRTSCVENENGVTAVQPFIYWRFAVFNSLEIGIWLP